MRNRGSTFLHVVGGITVFFAVCAGLFVLGIGARGCGVANRMLDDAADTTVKQFAPSVMLSKYEWFKDTAASLDAKRADIEVFAARLGATKATYGLDASKWPRDVRESNGLALSELAGMKASFNGLASDFNAQMSKFNWAAFERFGNVPAGAREALPREFKPYVEQ
jgi:hypothetical protein